MNVIKFSHNWNQKLDHKLFTTIRRWTYQKETYYKSQVGSDYKVYLENQEYTIATLKNVEIFGYGDIPTGLLIIDTGINNLKEVHATFRKFGLTPGTRAMILTFERK